MIEWQWALGIFLSLVAAAARVILKFSNDLTKLSGEMEQIKQELAEQKKLHASEKTATDDKLHILATKIDATNNQNSQILGKLDVIENFLMKNR